MAILQKVVCMVVMTIILASSAGERSYWSFDDVAPGSIPPGWMSESTGKDSVLALFRVERDTTHGKGKKENRILEVSGYKSSADYKDNHLCWTNSVSFEDGTIEADARVVSDSNAYGGGIAWRIKDKNNYYSLRFSCKEGNLNVFKIVDAKRSTIGKVSRPFNLSTWYHMKITISGSTFFASVDGKDALTVRDSSITGAGGVGVFQRANATKGMWDNFSVILANTVK